MMKKIFGFLAFVICLMILGGLTSCGNTTNSEKESDTTNTTDTSDSTDKHEAVKASVYDADWKSSIEYAAQLKNAVNGKFVNPKRTAYEISNSQMKFACDLSDAENKNVAYICNSEGKNYITKTMDTYVTDSDGIKYYSSQSIPKGRMNTFRLGYYYYDTHIMDLMHYTNEATTKQSVEPIDISNFEKGKWSGNMVSTPKFDAGVMSFKISDASDPYIVCGGKIDIDTKQYTTIEITMKTTQATNANLYIVAGSQAGFNEAQNVGFSVDNDGEFHTYHVLLDSVGDYTGKMTQLRIDVGGAVGEVIEISSIKAVGLSTQIFPIRLERNFHTYSDKLHEELRFVASADVDNIAGYGMETVIAKNTVNAVLIKDQNGEYTAEKLSDFDSTNVEFVAFDIDGAGIFGFIMPKTAKAGTNGTIEIEDDGENYIVRHVGYLAKTKLYTGMSLSFGDRIYTDMTHSFDGIKTESYIERNPLTDVSVTDQQDGANSLGYDAMLGAYVYNLNGTGFNEAYNELKDYHFKVTPEIYGDSVNRNIYIYTNTINGGLECAAVINESNELLPIPIEVCKNFCGEFEEPFYYPDDISYGDTIFPLTIKAGEAKKFTVLNLYQNWGKYPLKQLSSIQFHISYYHLSVGVTETNCIAPYFVYGKDGWVLPDFRGLSSELWTGQPQHYSYGRLYYPSYTDSDGHKYKSEIQSDEIASAGPVYADISSNYLLDDQKTKLTVRHLEMPQTDETRTYYSFRFDFTDTVSVNDFKNNFEIFATDGRISKFKNLGYLDAEGKETVKALDFSKEFSEIIELGKNHPYFDLFHAIDSSETVNFGLIVKNSEIVIGGQKQDIPFALKNQYKGGFNYAALTLLLDDVTFSAGDYIDINFILLPFGDDTVENDNSVRYVREDSAVNPYVLDVKTGTLVNDDYLPQVAAIDGKAEFTLSGGRGNTVIRVDGFNSYERPSIYTADKNGNYSEYKTDTYGYDGIQSYANDDGTYSFAFVLGTYADVLPAVSIRVEQ